MMAAITSSPYFRFGGVGNDAFALAGSQTSGVGLGGSDQITGTGGNNFLVGDFFTLAYFDCFNSAGNQIAPLPAYDLTQRGQDVLYGGAMNDTLVADQGDDLLNGGTGDDTFLVWSQDMGVDRFRGGSHAFRGDVVVFEDTWQLGFTYFFTMRLVLDQAAEIESVRLNGFGLHGTAGDDLFDFGGTSLVYGAHGAQGQAIEMGAGDDRFTGSTSGDTVRLGSGDDTADGRDGANVMFGDDGNDRIRCGPDGDTLYGGSGNDTLTGGGGWAVIYGGAGDDLINAGHSTSDGGVGRDTITANTATGGGDDDVLTGVSLSGDAGNDVLTGLRSEDSLAGGSGDDSLTGNAYDDRLYGGAGADRMEGGAGNDVYEVDNLLDVVVELATARGGIDTVQTVLTLFHMQAGIERLVFLTAEDCQGSGTAAKDSIDGDAGNDSLAGLEGDDQILGGDGANTLDGGAGNDTIGCGAGGSLIFGGSGDDFLGGGAGNDTIFGGLGHDTLSGGDGDDLFVMDDAGAIIAYWIDQGGSDTVQTALERFEITYYDGIENLTHDAASDFLGRGNRLANVLVGNAGADTLDGLGARDTLTGGEGADVFVFSTMLATGNVDTIVDFTPGTDRIRLEGSAFGAPFAGMTAGRLSVSAFKELGAGNALDADDRILFDPATGRIFYDSDGNGAGGRILFAYVAAGTVLSHGDFWVT